MSLTRHQMSNIVITTSVGGGLSAVIELPDCQSVSLSVVSTLSTGAYTIVAAPHTTSTAPFPTLINPNTSAGYTLTSGIMQTIFPCPFAKIGVAGPSTGVEAVAVGVLVTAQQHV